MLFALFLISLFAAAIALQNHPVNPGKTALDEYVWRPDANYGWVELEDKRLHGKSNIHGEWTGYVLNVTSQAWLTPQDFSPNSPSGSIWYHILVVVVPEKVEWTRNATMYITGSTMPNADGSNIPDTSSEDIRIGAALATSSNIITGILFQIPNEHTIFTADPIQKSRSEDGIIAFTWDHFLKNPDQPEWLLRFPMVKGSLRAMDAMKEFAAQKLPTLGTSLDYFIVAGASKRGWTTWDVGVVDPNRVMAIVPIVLDAINFIDVMHHQYQSYNGWSWALHDYLDENIMTRLDEPNMMLLSQNVDPYYYRNRLTMPKLVVNAVADEFQQPDDNHYWWNDMPEPKHAIMTPNAEHSEATGIFEIVPAIGAWCLAHLKKETVPEFTWDISTTTGEITVTLNHVGKVKVARVWWAYSCGFNPDGSKRRDFRIATMDSPCQCGKENSGKCMNLKSLWQHEILEEKSVNGKRVYTAHVDAPTDGRWVAYFIDVVYALNEKDALIPFKKITPGFIPRDLEGRLQFTTQVSVWPQTFPFPGCGINPDGTDTGLPCLGTIV